MASSTQIIQRAGVDQTVRIYDNFYGVKLQVNAGDYDVVYSYFKGVSGSTVIAANFTTLLLRIAQEGGFNVIELLEIIKGAENKLQMNNVICYYLNTFKSKTSLYGTGIIPAPNQAVQRNVVL